MKGSQPSRTSDAVIYIPGIMGSELVDAGGKVVWGLKPGLFVKQAVFGDVLDRLHVRPGDGIRATRPVGFPASLPFVSSMEPYTEIDHRLRQVTLRPEAVLAYPYDWRKSIGDAAAGLAPIARRHLAGWRTAWETLPDDEKEGYPEPRLSLVGHSMGGLVASWFAAFLDDESMIRRVVTLGTPFFGSLNAVAVLSTGRALPFGLFAESLRDAGRTMPGLYELVARWKSVPDDGGGYRAITPADLGNIGADPGLAETADATMRKLKGALHGEAGRMPPLRPMVGTTQPTLQSVRFANGTAQCLEEIGGTDERGDGTVFRYSAAPERTVPAYLPQSHGALAKTNEGVEFATAVLTERPLGQFLAPAGIGVRVPDMVRAGERFAVDVLDAEPGVMCRLDDAESGEFIGMVPADREDGRVRAWLASRGPGLHRVSVSGGGYSPVERLVSVVGPD